MAVFYKKEVEDGFIAIWDITESVDFLLDKAELLESELVKFNSITNRTRKLEFLCVRALLNEILGRKILIQYEGSGRPIIDHDKFISISHAKNFVGIHFSKHKEVGIDLEIVSERVKRIQQRFLNTTELNAVNRKKEVKTLILLWSAKECIFKMMPHLNIDFRDNIEVHVPDVENKGVFFAEFINNDEIYSLKLAYQFIRNFVLVYNIYKDEYI